MMPDRCIFRFFIEIIANSDDIRLEIFGPITILHIIVIRLSVFRLETFKNSQRVFHVVMEVSANKVVKSLDSVVENSDIVDSSKNVNEV